MHPAPIQVYSVHSWTAYEYGTRNTIGMAKVIKDATFSISGELVKSNGGSSPYPWAIEEGLFTAEAVLNAEQIEAWMFQIFGGNSAVIDNTPSATGTVSALTNVKGTSISNAVTGVASVSITAGKNADLKWGWYLIKAITADTYMLYTYSDLDFKRGDDISFENEKLEILSNANTLATDTGEDIAKAGITVTGGSGVVALVPGDTAIFRVEPPYQKKYSVKLGGSSDVLPEFGIMMYAKKRSNGELFEIDAYRCKGSGLPIGMSQNTWSAPEMKAEALYDSVQDGVVNIEWIKTG